MADPILTHDFVDGCYGRRLRVTRREGGRRESRGEEREIRCKGEGRKYGKGGGRMESIVERCGWGYGRGNGKEGIEEKR